MNSRIDKGRLETAQKLAVRYIETFVNENIEGLPIPLVLARLSNIILHNKLKVEYASLTATHIINQIEKGSLKPEEIKAELQGLKLLLRTEPEFNE